MCNKTPYPSARAAREAMNNIRQSKHRGAHKDNRPVRAYRCEMCHEWHLSSKPAYFDQETNQRHGDWRTRDLKESARKNKGNRAKKHKSLWYIPGDFSE